jgi:hypothetical protein
MYREFHSEPASRESAETCSTYQLLSIYGAFHNVLRDYFYLLILLIFITRKPKNPTVMEMFTATGKLKIFLTTRDV